MNPGEKTQIKGLRVLVAQKGYCSFRSSMAPGDSVVTAQFPDGITERWRKTSEPSCSKWVIWNVLLKGYIRHFLAATSMKFCLA